MSAAGAQRGDRGGGVGSQKIQACGWENIYPNQEGVTIPVNAEVDMHHVVAMEEKETLKRQGRDEIIDSDYYYYYCFMPTSFQIERSLRWLSLSNQSYGPSTARISIATRFTDAVVSDD